MAYDENLAARVRQQLSGRDDISERKMFGGLAFMVGDHMACGVLKDELIVRVDPDSNAASLPSARPFDFTGRPSRGMVYVAPGAIATEDALRGWVDRGVAAALARGATN
jgi:hypothetical protein